MQWNNVCFDYNIVRVHAAMPYESYSFDENKAMSAMENNMGGFLELTHHHLIRTYPKGMRIDSSNYNPVPLWLGGCQIVALNMQFRGLEMDLNEAMFRDNGCLGYVLKPDTLLDRTLTIAAVACELRILAKRVLARRHTPPHVCVRNREERSAIKYEMRFRKS